MDWWKEERLGEVIELFYLKIKKTKSQTKN